MRLFWVVLLGLLSLVAGACADEVITTEERVRSETQVVTVEVGQAVPTEVPAEEPTASPTEEPPAAAGTVIGDGLFPTVVGVTADARDASTWNVSVTLSSEYDTQDRYADAWRVLDAADNELGIRILGHDHANEQPFTRSTTVDIPADIDVVYIEGRDQLNGWSGERFELTLTR